MSYKREIEESAQCEGSSVDAVGSLIVKVQLETAQRCAAIAVEVADSYTNFPSDHAVGAETVAVEICRQFGLEKLNVQR